jgi:hypothetical protein
MKIRVRYNCWLVPPGYKAWVLYPWMLFRDAAATDRLFRHELEHVYQVRRLGWVRFYATYLWYSLRYGYRNNPFEIEAELAESAPLTAAERELKREASDE